MRLPFLQVESDLLAHGAPAVAALAGCGVAQALGHITLLRAWAVSQGQDGSPPDGWVRDSDAGALIEAAAQWHGDPGRLLRALRIAKQVEQYGEHYRVTGMEPYAHAWARNEKARERMANARERSQNTAKHPSSSPQQTQTQTQRKKRRRSPSPPPAAEGPSEQPVLVLEVQQAGPTPEQAASERRRVLKAGMERVFQEITGREYQSPKPQVDNATVIWLSEQAEDEEVLRRWRNLLAWAKDSPNGYPTVRHLGALREHWVVGQVTDGPARRRAPGGAWAAPARPVTDEEMERSINTPQEEWTGRPVA